MPLRFNRGSLFQIESMTQFSPFFYFWFLLFHFTFNSSIRLLNHFLFVDNQRVHSFGMNLGPLISCHRWKRPVGQVGLLLKCFQFHHCSRDLKALVFLGSNQFCWRLLICKLPNLPSHLFSIYFYQSINCHFQIIS